MGYIPCGSILADWATALKGIAVSSKRRLRRKGCEGKIVYVTFEIAQQTARFLGRKLGEKLNAYKCSFGHHYHVGHAPAALRRLLAHPEELNG